MKKTLLAIFVAAIVLGGVSFASAAEPTPANILPSTWQAYNSGTNHLVVYWGVNDKSGICYDGVLEKYDGHCVFPAEISQAYTAWYNATHK
jgi:hypothetical protein